MFICKKCLEKHYDNTYYIDSFGFCEICDKDNLEVTSIHHNGLIRKGTLKKKPEVDWKRMKKYGYARMKSNLTTNQQ